MKFPRIQQDPQVTWKKVRFTGETVTILEHDGPTFIAMRIARPIVDAGVLNSPRSVSRIPCSSPQELPGGEHPFALRARGESESTVR